MFHHFYDEQKHIKGQGAISAQELDALLDFYGETHHIIPADEFFVKSQRNSLSEKDVCLSFDDGLLCQYEVAYPVLERRNLRAFWFIYTSPMEGVLEKLEIYRHFRFSAFKDIEDFYAAFFETAKRMNKAVEDALQNFNPDEYAKDFPFYTPNDKRFRYLRDKVLGESQYNRIMDGMLAEYHYDIAENSKLLWIKSEQIRDLHAHGHIIGLHSHTHPTVMDSKSFDEQMSEYSRNKKSLDSIIGEEITAVSYPCNSYNRDTLRCMRELRIQIGFRANMACERIGDENEKTLEYPREDHANIMKQMREAVK